MEFTDEVNRQVFYAYRGGKLLSKSTWTLERAWKYNETAEPGHEIEKLISPDYYLTYTWDLLNRRFFPKYKSRLGR